MHFVHATGPLYVVDPHGVDQGPSMLARARVKCGQERPRFCQVRPMAAHAWPKSSQVRPTFRPNLAEVGRKWHSLAQFRADAADAGPFRSTKARPTSAKSGPGRPALAELARASPRNEYPTHLNTSTRIVEAPCFNSVGQRSQNSSTPPNGDIIILLLGQRSSNSFSIRHGIALLLAVRGSAPKFG